MSCTVIVMTAMPECPYHSWIANLQLQEYHDQDYITLGQESLSDSIILVDTGSNHGLISGKRARATRTRQDKNSGC